MTIHGREACRSFAYKITRSKTTLDDWGKELTEGWRKSTSEVNAERRIVRERLESLADEVRAPLTAYETAEQERVDGHEAALAAIPAPAGYGPGATAAELVARLADLRAYPARDWQEFAPRATELLAAEITRMETLHAAAVVREAEAAELAELRALRDDQRRREAAQEAAAAQEARDAEIARQAAERSRIRQDQAAAAAAQQAAERERQAQIAVAQAEERTRAAEARAATLAAEAVAAEQQRVAAEAQRELEAEARRIANTRHRNKVQKAAREALVAGGLSEGAAARAIELIAAGDVPRVALSY